VAERVDQIVAAFEKTNADFIAFVEGLTDAQWQTTVPNEQRTVGVVAHHVAESINGTVAGVVTLGSGRPLTFTAESINQGNAMHALQHANATRDETIAALRANGAKALRMLRRLSESQLDRSANVAFSGRDMTAHQFAEFVVIGHINQHLANMKAALG
jgi:hypothetical protein